MGTGVPHITGIMGTGGPPFYRDYGDGGPHFTGIMGTGVPILGGPHFTATPVHTITLARSRSPIIALQCFSFILECLSRNETIAVALQSRLCSRYLFSHAVPLRIACVTACVMTYSFWNYYI